MIKFVKYMSDNKKIHPIVENLIKILAEYKIERKTLFDSCGFSEAKVSKILNGHQNLRIDELSKIARSINMREIDIITYPKVFREIENYNTEVKAQLTVELNDELKDDVLKLVFGNSNLKLIKK